MWQQACHYSLLLPKRWLKVVLPHPPAKKQHNFDLGFWTRSSQGMQSAGADRRVEAEPHLPLLAAAWIWAGSTITESHWIPWESATGFCRTGLYAVSFPPTLTSPLLQKTSKAVWFYFFFFHFIQKMGVKLYIHETKHPFSRQPCIPEACNASW